MIQAIIGQRRFVVGSCSAAMAGCIAHHLHLHITDVASPTSAAAAPIGVAMGSPGCRMS